MNTSVREYDAKLDSKKRITLRGCIFEYYHVKEKEDGTVLFEPRELKEEITSDEIDLFFLIGRKESI